MNSMYKNFATNPELEQNGVTIDYGDFRVTIARAGGANKKFAKALEAKTKPMRRALEAQMVSKERQVEIVREAFVETSVLNWEVRVKEATATEPAEYKRGIEGPNGDILEFTKENVIMTFKNLPDLYDVIQDEASRATLFKSAALEDEAKN